MTAQTGMCFDPIQSKKILVVGASGFLGNRIYDFFKEHGAIVVGTYFQNQTRKEFIHLDITSSEQLNTVLSEFLPDIILWVAGSKNLKFCEENIENAKTINTYPLEAYIKASKKIGIHPYFLFFSTDYVYNGKDGDFRDSDSTDPCTNYGKSNLMAEKILQKEYQNFSIIRTSAVMGSRGGTFFSWLIKEMATPHHHIELFADSFFSPTPVAKLLQDINFIIANEKKGTFNSSGGIRMTRYDFAQMIKKLDKKFIADLIPVNRIDHDVLFQYDLSLVPSNCFTSLTEEEFLSFLQEEI